MLRDKILYHLFFNVNATVDDLITKFKDKEKVQEVLNEFQQEGILKINKGRITVNMLSGNVKITKVPTTKEFNEFMIEIGNWTRFVKVFPKEDAVYDILSACLINEGYIGFKYFCQRCTYHDLEKAINFLKASELVILPNGDVVAYKYICKHNGMYVSCWDKQTVHEIGKVVEVDDVDTNEDQACSYGLHVGSVQYMRNVWYEGNYLAVVIVRPEDIKAIPNQEATQKMRVQKYEILNIIDIRKDDLTNKRLKTIIIDIFKDTLFSDVISQIRRYLTNVKVK